MTTRRSRIVFGIGLILAIVAGRDALSGEPELLPREQRERGWIQLFDGATLFGWQATGSAEWRVEAGTVRTDGEKPGFLMTTSEFADYELSLEFMADEETNSGVFLRTPLEPTDPASNCYEVNIAPPDNPFPTGSLVGRRKVAPQVSGRDAPTGWRTLLITARRGNFTVDLDDERVLVYEDRSPLRIGHIGLQSNDGPVAFRNIRLRPLGLRSIFNGEDLTGWNTAEARDSEYEVTDEGELRAFGGPGQIETDEQYTNFVMQLECKVHVEGGNSGIFFRTQPERLWLGYESQIHNLYRDGDPTQPSDFGTGGIYRRQPARRVVADDGEWFTKTILANGPHFAVWVNGYQVSDWTDDRPPHDSPREGKRLEGGVIAIQAHDPETDLSFRDLRIVELPR